MARQRRLGARELLATVLDDGSWQGWDAAPSEPAEPGSAYAAELAAAAERSGCDEAIVTGEGRIRGRRVAVVAGEFAFLAGSIGVVAAERLVAGVRAGDRARAAAASPRRSRAAPGCRRARPPSCGWSRSARPCAQLKAAGLPYLVYLRHPTTGGVFASWGSLGQVTVAEPAR